MAKFIYIEGDSDESEIIGLLTEISDEDLNIITPLLKAILNNKEDNNYDITPWSSLRPRKMYPQFSDEIHLALEAYTPFGEHGIQNITNVIIIDGKEIKF